MWRSPEHNQSFLRDVETRATAIEEATSNPVRIVFHQPGGWYNSDAGMRGAVANVALMNGETSDGRALYPWRWNVWADEVKAMSDAHPEWTLAVYFSGQMPTSVELGTLNVMQGYENYDHDDARHRRLMTDVVDQWLKVGVDEFILDHTSGPDTGADVPRLVEATRAQGGRLLVEAHPRDSYGRLNSSYLRRVDGSLSTHRFMVGQEPASLGWTVPAGSVMMIALTNHPVEESPSRSPATWNDVDGYRARGFTILSGAPAYDHYVSQASSTN